MKAVEAEPARSPDFSDLLRQMFGISEVELRICLVLMEVPDVTATEVAATVDVDESTARRQLKHLVELGLVEREEKLRRKGGFAYVYTPVPPDEQRQRLKIELYAWVEDALGVVEDIEREKLEAAARETSGDGDSSNIYRE
jgi:predicted transcriptional regulator